MNYSVKATTVGNQNASIQIKQSKIDFGITAESSDSLPNPAELFLGSLSACILKNVERFSNLMQFDYYNAEIIIGAIRQEKPPKMDEIHYVLKIYSQDANLNLDLLQKNIEKFGTIYNTVKATCILTGTIEKITL
ncbi:OsmC family protein [Flavobacterium chuncheonense]|uniref:OsmC family protein n=1 Tax=Flavobacterium chuncheonense TaxID=2026653 RepID=A0ABW5YQ68_9FLAO